MRRFLVFATLGLLGWSACGSEAVSAASCCAEDLADRAPLPDTSVFQLDSVWRDAAGGERRLADLRGRPTVAAMVFTNCRYACPQIVADLRRIDAALPPEAADGVRWLLVTMDPARDTPAVLRTFAERYDLDPARWTLLQGDAESTNDLAAVLGVRYVRQPDGDYAHSNVIIVLDRDGRIAHRQTGLNASIEPTVLELTRLVE